MTYDTFIFLMGAVSTGGIIWFIGDKVRQATRSGLNLFSWQGFTDSVSAVFQAIGLKRERKQSIESFIEEMTAVNAALLQFKSRYQESRQLEIAFNSITIGEGRQYASQIYDLLSQIQGGVKRVEASVGQATAVAASQINLSAIATGMGANLPKPGALPPGPPAYATTPGVQATPVATGEAPLTVSIDDDTMYMVTDFTVTDKANAQSNMFGSVLRRYITKNNLVVGTTIMFCPKQFINKPKADASSAF
jgi:hypothetical protein